MDKLKNEVKVWIYKILNELADEAIKDNKKETVVLYDKNAAEGVYLILKYEKNVLLKF